MFELIFSNYQDPQGKLSKQLLAIPDWSPFVTEVQSTRITHMPSHDKFDEMVLSYSHILSGRLSTENSKGLEIVEDLFKSVKEELSLEEPIESDLKTLPLIRKSRFNNSEIESFQICLKTIFLDFLFDLKHSDVFAYSKHYDRLLNISRSNFVFDAVVKICEYQYWRKDHFIASQKRQIKSLRNWQTKHRIDSIQNMIRLLTTQKASVLLGKSPWINANLEASLYQAVDELTDTYDSFCIQGDESIWHQVSEWATRRYSYLKFVKAITPLNWIHFVIFLFPFVLIFWMLHHGEGSLSSSKIVSAEYFGFLKSGILILIMLICGLVSNVRKWGKSRTPFLRAMLILVSPKIVLSSIFAWGAIEIFDPVESYLNQISVNSHLIFAILGALLIPLLYLYREILEEAPDLNSGKIFVRTISAEIIVLATIFIIGVPTLAFSNMLAPVEEIAKYGKPVSIIREAILATPFVFFTLVFTKTLFAGKRFTGM